MHNGGVPGGKEIQSGGNIDQGFSKTDQDTKTQIKEALWILVAKIQIKPCWDPS